MPSAYAVRLCPALSVALVAALLWLPLPSLVAAPASPLGAPAPHPGSFTALTPSAATSASLSLPNPVSYSAMGDSITTGYDANSTLTDLGEQPYYSYAVGWNTSVFSFYERLEHLYGYGTVTSHLLAVPGDKASDMIWQALEAVQNHSGFVTVLIGGNDVCSSSGGNPAPTPVWNFSASLNHSFRILRHDLPASTVISLADVVNVSLLWTLFGGDTQAEEVWQSTCPALLTTAGRADMLYMIKAYNHIEQRIAQVYNLTLWDIGNLSFSVGDVNHLDYFHPSPEGHEEVAEEWWSVLPYAQMLPRFTSPPALPASVPVATPLSVQVGVQDVSAPTVTATYKETGSLFWSTTSLSFASGLPYNGSYAATLPYNATAVAGLLDLYVEVSDVSGYLTTLPSGAPTSLYQVQVVGSGSSPPAPLASVALSPGQLQVSNGEATTFTATPSCTGGPCPSGVAYQWNLTPETAGQLLPENGGSEALFVAGVSSSTAWVNVTARSGVFEAKGAAEVQLSASGPPSHQPAPQGGSATAASPAPLLPFGDLVLVAVGVFLAVMALLGFLLPSRPRSKGEQAGTNAPSPAPAGGGEPPAP